LGGKWGEKFNEDTAKSILNRAIDLGINFIDTADRYNYGMSEKMIGQVLKKRNEKIFVATKCGRWLDPFTAEGFNDKNIRKWVDDSRKNLNMEVLDIVQLHNPPTEIYYNPEVFEILEKLKEEGNILNYGVSVFTVEEALKAVEYPGLATVQLLYNIFRQRPEELLFKQAKKKNVGIIIRRPLASGLLTGKFRKDTVFAGGDHRLSNVKGNWKNNSEAFSGIPFNIGLEAVEKLKEMFPKKDLPKYALKWILMNENISCIIPGASEISQVESNVKASEISSLRKNQMELVNSIYNKYIKKYIHQRW